MDKVKVIQKFPKGTVTLPPSKSVSHRAVLCAALAAKAGESRIRNIALSEDISATLSAIEALGCSWRREDNTVVIAGDPFSEKDMIDCGESGSTLRFLIPVAAQTGRSITLTGRGRLMERPMGIYSDVFEQAGAHFAQGNGVISVRGPLPSGSYSLPGDVSSQFVTGLLLALPTAQGDSEIRLTTPLESRGYVDLTLDVMRRFGVDGIHSDPSAYRIAGGQTFRPREYAVEGDWSQAAFLLGAAALGCDVSCTGLELDSLQGDRAILRILRDMGAVVESRFGAISVSAPNGLGAVTVDAREIPDLVPPVAALCCFCRGTSRIINAGRLRIKESDRLHAMTRELTALGAVVHECADSLTIEGRETLAGGRVDAHNDHRIAMSMALAAIRCRGPVELTGADSVKKSWPSFWEEFEQEVRNG